MDEFGALGRQSDGPCGPDATNQPYWLMFLRAPSSTLASDSPG
jgi:hypothetical protein